MALLKRLSDTFWSYVPPRKPIATKTTPKTVPQKRKQLAQPRRKSMQDVIDRSRSMSPVERVDSWRLESESHATSSVVHERKRKRSSSRKASSESTPLKRGRGRPRKRPKIEAVDIEYDGDVVIENEDEDMTDPTSDISNINVGKSPSSGYVTEEDGEEEDSFGGPDDSLVVSEQDYENYSPGSKKLKLISPTEALFDHGVSTESMRAEGWDDDHINLVQHIAMRGFEPIMPGHWKFEYRTFPDGLFSDEDEGTAIGSVCGNHFHATKALDPLLVLGGWVRDRAGPLKGRVTPEMEVRKKLKEYIKWADRDSGLDKETAIPILTIENKPSHISSEVLANNAKRKLAALATRYREAFRVRQSIENSPRSHASTILSDPLPTLYAIIASHTLIALVAYNPNDTEPEVKSVAFFDMKDNKYDVWNSLALAIIVCHCRNVQVRIAEETGLGVKVAGKERNQEGG